MNDTENLNLRNVTHAVRTSSFWKDLIFHEVVGSTNDAAKALAFRGAPAGTVVVADEQTAGRGRLNRRWVAPPQSSLLCSLVFRPALPPRKAQKLTMLCAMASADAIRARADLEVALKWPNDLVVASQTLAPGSSRWRKLAGLLTETEVTNGTVAFVVVGIGINVNVPEDTLDDLSPDATSILVEIGHRVDRGALLADVLAAIEARYERLKRGEDPHREWASRLATLGRQVVVTTGKEQLRGIAAAVNEDGALLLRTEDGSLRPVRAGDVSLPQH